MQEPGQMESKSSYSEMKSEEQLVARSSKGLCNYENWSTNT